MTDKKISILAIEDNAADCRLIEEILKESESFNYKIQFAHNLADGILMISGNIDVILLDLNLQDSNGIETLKKIQKNNIPIIILSGIQDIELANESIKFGAQDYLVKGTYDYNLLIRSIKYSIERDQIQKNLTISEERFKKLVASITDYIYTVNIKNGKPISTQYGEGCITVTGYSSEEFEKDQYLWYNIIYDEDKTFVAKLASKLLTGEEIKSFEHRIIHKNGSIRWVRNSHVLRKNNLGEIEGYDGLIEDITERKRVEEALKESEWKLKEAQRLGRIGHWEFDLKTEQIQWSDMVFSLYERAPKLSPPSLEEEASYYSPEDAERLKNSAKQAIETGISYEINVRIILKQNRYRDVVATGTPILDTTGHVIKLLGTVQDVTERKKAEEEIKKLNIELEKKVLERTAELVETNKELESFSYSVSHDLRAPLRSIDGFSYILLEKYSDKLGKEGKDLIDRIRNSTQLMSSLIEDLLSLSKASRYDINYQTIDFTIIVNSIILEMKKINPERKIDIIIKKVPKVESDINMLSIALTNLINNAWKFTEKISNPKIEFGFTKEKEEIVYFIKDNGAGFDMAYADKLFGAFQRLHTQKEFPGTGIGLALVKRIFNRLGGRIWFDAKVGKGATFYFVLPNKKLNKNI